MAGKNDRRITVRQATDLVNGAYDRFETFSIEAITRTLKEEFGFGPVRMERFMGKYLEYIGEDAASYADKVRQRLRKGI